MFVQCCSYNAAMVLLASLTVAGIAAVIAGGVARTTTEVVFIPKGGRVSMLNYAE